jgi:hypothetical protein
MTFLHGALAIAGLAAIAIPIIIHLLSRRRRRPVEWAAMRFLLEAFQKHKRRLQLEQLILLALRCLALALLGLALARPLLERTGIIPSGGSRAVYLVIDNGMASGLVVEPGRTALQAQIDHARGIVQSLRPGDVVGVVTAARPARAAVIPPSTDHASVIELLESLQPSESATDLPAAFNVLRTSISDVESVQDSAVVYLLSEFRSGSVSLESALPPAFVEAADRLTLIASPPAQQPITNIQVIAIDPVRSTIIPGSIDASGQMTVRLARTGSDLPAEVSQVRLLGEGLATAESRVVEWRPGDTRADIDFIIDPTALGEGEVGLTAAIEADTLRADNQRFITLELRKQIRVLIVDRYTFGLNEAIDRMRAAGWIRRALEPVEESPISVAPPLDPSAMDVTDLRLADVAIVTRPDLISDAGWKALRAMVDRGGLVVVMPPSDINVHQWTDRLRDELGLPWRIALEVVDHPEGLGMADEQPGSELLRMISSELPDLSSAVVATRVLPIDMEQTQAETILRFADGSPMLIAGSPQAAGSAPSESPPASMSNATGQAERASGQSSNNASKNAQSATSGLVVYLAVAPEFSERADESWTNLPLRSLMLPLFQEIVRQGVGLSRGQQHYVVGTQPAVMSAHGAGSLVALDDRTGGGAGEPGRQNRTPIALDATGRAVEPLERAGLYAVQDSFGEVTGTVAVNVEPAAGQTAINSPAAVMDWLGRSGHWTMFDRDDPAAALRAADTGLALAGMLLLAVLGVLLLETLLARWFSHALQQSASAAGAQGGGLRPTMADRLMASHT